uniref:Putative GH23: distantly related to lytic murein transglycosylase n=1 Tax=Magnetococcus massalia (strain MO-1) TaxID=451514 RepID=A0A1S7LN96_MAGMO|nr:putative GH23 : distantly related to lytic murein transglycosylase [Candidatus Magnetococcus massalia]
MHNLQRLWLLVALLPLLLASCATLPPANLDDACMILEHESDWYKATRASEKRWGIPIHVQLAIVHQESRFRADARPPKRRLLWVIPWGRASSAKGYAQALDATWEWYKQKTGNRWAERDDFTDAVDFIGWYADISRKKLGISLNDTENQYLAYHEGHTGYARKNYKKKRWLTRVAKKVAVRSHRYQNQLNKCMNRLERGSRFLSL